MMSRPARRWCVLALMLLATIGATATGPTAARADSQPWMNTSLTPDQRADLLIAEMTLAEKVTLLAGDAPCLEHDDAKVRPDGHVPGIARLGIPAQTMVGAGAGVTGQCPNVTRQATALPAPIAMAASWDVAAATEDGKVIGRETRAFGMNVALSGGSNLARNPLAGRVWEAEGEDPLLTGKLVAAQTRGIQSHNVVATLKHYVGNEQEQNRVGQNSVIDERTLREVYLRAFEIGVREGNPGAVMCSYNKVNGTPACQAPATLGVLKNEWNFPGWVMTDWLACTGTYQPFPNGEFFPDLTNICGTQQSVQAGLDQQQPFGTYYSSALLTATVNAGLVQTAQIDAMAHRILRTMFAFGLFDHPVIQAGTAPATTLPGDLVNEGADDARSLAERSAVLLKNEGGALPLAPAAPGSIAVIGAPAAAAPAASGSTGSGYVTPVASKIVTALNAIKQRVPGRVVNYTDGTNLSAATALAASAQTVLVFARDSQVEGHDRKSLALDPLGSVNADELISAVTAANPNTTVVLQTGGPVTMPWLSQVKAVLEAWYPGEQGGAAIAALLFGDVNPAGRLPITFPLNETQLPTPKAEQWPGTPRRIEYTEKLKIGYRWYEAEGLTPLFPFGYGLSYGAQFDYSSSAVTPAIAAQPAVVQDGHQLTTLTATVTNTGSREAAETAQVYVGFPAGADEPAKRLAGWQKVQVAAGQSAPISVALDDRALSYWDVQARQWKIACGGHPIYVGSSATDLRQAGTLTVDC
jgi:beta-glucosidase